jgi:hypothetical protein
MACVCTARGLVKTTPVPSCFSSHAKAVPWRGKRLSWLLIFWYWMLGSVLTLHRANLPVTSCSLQSIPEVSEYCGSRQRVAGWTGGSHSVPVCFPLSALPDAFAANFSLPSKVFDSGHSASRHVAWRKRQPVHRGNDITLG